MMDIQDFEPEATAILAWRLQPMDKMGRVESLALGPCAPAIEALAAAILEGGGGPNAGSPQSGNDAGVCTSPSRHAAAVRSPFWQENVIGPFRITATPRDGGSDASYLFTALDLGDGYDARLAIGMPSRGETTAKAAPASVVDQVLAPQAANLRRAFRSLMAYRALQEARAETEALADVATDPVLLVALDGRLLAANGKARVLLDAGHLASLSRDSRLILPSSEQQTALRRVLTGLASKSACGPAALRLPGADDAAQHWLLASVAGEGRFALTFKSIASDGALVATPVLMRTFDLTRTEAQLVAALSAGQTLKDYAEAAARKETTVRWHLSNALEKMGCRNQTGVVRLVLRLFAA